LLDTSQRMVPEDNDNAREDVYLRSAGVTSLVTAPEPGVADPPNSSAANSRVAADGQRVIFLMEAPMTAESGDGADGKTDLYEHSGGHTSLVSVPSGAPTIDDHVTNVALARDGTGVLFDTLGRFTTDDGDVGAERSDLYRANLAGLAAPPADEPCPQEPSSTPPGGNGGAGSAAAADRVAPAAAGFSAKPKTFVEGDLLPALVAKRSVGTVFRFSLSEPAAVSVRFARARPGRRVRGRCRKPGRKRGRRCTRFVTVKGAISVTGRGGSNKLRFQGRISRKLRLKPGRYRATLLATDAAGNRSRAIRATFRIVRRKRR
jgi:hypothetical protein